MKRETVVFDLGGVVFNWEPLRLMQEVFAQRVHNPTQAAQLLAQVFQSHQTHGDWAQWDKGLVTPKELARRIGQRLGMPVSEIESLLRALAPHMRLKTETVALIQELRAMGHRTAYLSNMPEELAQWIERDHPFSDWFEDGVFSARVHQAKPDEAIFRTLLDRLDLHDQAPVFIDDMAVNVSRAQSLGFRGHVFLDAAKTREHLRVLGLLTPYSR